MTLKELQASIKRRPEIYIGSLDSKGINALIFNTLWDLFKIMNELEVSVHIKIKKDCLSFRISDSCGVLNKNLCMPNHKYLGLFICISLAQNSTFYLYNNKIEINELEQLSALVEENISISAVELIFDYSFFRDILDRSKLFFELKGKARFFSAINSKCKVILEDENLSTFSEIFYRDGLGDFLREIDYDRTIACHGQVFEANYQNDSGRFNLCLRPCYSGPKIIYSFANGDRTVGGGTHEKGLKKSISKFARVINKTLEHKSNSNKFFCPRFTSYTAVISVFMDTSQYDGSTKDRLINEEAYQLVVEGISNNINKWLEQLLRNV